MTVRALIADDDMDVHHLLCDVLEISFRDVKIERALSLQSFWEKIGGNGEPWHAVFLSVEYIREEPDGFLDRVVAASPETLCRIVLVGRQQDFDGCDDEVRQMAFLAKPFSLDRFEEIVKEITNNR